MIQILRGLLSNIVLFLVAFTAAIAIWLAAQQQADPVNTQLWQVPIEITGEPANARISIQHETVQVLVEGPNSALAELSNDRFVSFVDLSQQPYGTVNVPIQVQVDVPDITIIARTPEETTVEMEEIISRELPVAVEVRGTAASGYQLEEAIADPETVTVTGIASRVNSLAEARVNVFVDNPRETESFTLRPFFYSQEGTVASVTGLSIDPDFIQITVPAEQLEGVTNKPITAGWVGLPAQGYRLLNVTVEPQSVLVTGPPNELESLRLLNTEPVDITGLKESETQQVTLELPEGIELVEPQPIFVTVEIEPILISSVEERPLELRALGEGLTATVSADTVRVFLFGPLETIDSLATDDVRVTLDLLNLTQGRYDLEPLVSISANDVDVRSTQPSFVSVVITPVVMMTDTITTTVGVTETSTLPPMPVTPRSTSSPVQSQRTVTAVGWEIRELAGSLCHQRYCSCQVRCAAHEMCLERVRYVRKSARLQVRRAAFWPQARVARIS